MCNCASMAWESPLDPCCTQKADFIDVLEWVYLYIFTVELMSKILAYGFIGHHHSYLRDAWCQLDFIVVTLAWLPILFPSFGNYSVIRSVRALRPLRALKRVPGMPVLIGSIMQAMPKLGNVVALCGFIFLVFGIVGMEVFKGALHFRCTSQPGFVETPGHPLMVARRRLLEIESPSLYEPPAFMMQEQQQQQQVVAGAAAAITAGAAAGGGGLIWSSGDGLLWPGLLDSSTKQQQQQQQRQQKPAAEPHAARAERPASAKGRREGGGRRRRHQLPAALSLRVAVAVTPPPVERRRESSRCEERIMRPRAGRLRFWHLLQPDGRPFDLQGRSGWAVPLCLL